MGKLVNVLVREARDAKLWRCTVHSFVPVILKRTIPLLLNDVGVFGAQTGVPPSPLFQVPGLSLYVYLFS